MKWLRIICWQLLVNCAVGWAQPYVIVTVAGGGAPPTPVPGAQAAIGPPRGVAADAAGNVYFTSGFACVFKLDQSGTMTRYAGTCRPGYSGDGGPATSAQIFNPSGVATDSSGNLYIAETYPYSRVRKVSTSGIISTLAGNGALLAGSSGDGGPATSASLGFGPLNQPAGLAVDSAGNIYIADTNGNRIRKISSATGIIATVAGTGRAGYSGDGGPAISAQLSAPVGVAVDAAGNLYIADSRNLRVREVSTAGVITTVAGNGTTTPSSGVGGPAINFALGPGGVAVDSAGNLYISSSIYIYKVSAAGIITLAAGGFYGFSGDGGPASRAGLTQPIGVALDSAGNMYIADEGNDRVRKVSAAGTITTVAGNGSASSGDGGPATSAILNFTGGVATDSGGNLYVTDTQSERVRKVSPAGVITTVAGNGTYGFAGDGGAAVNAELATPYGLAIDSAGNLYIGDAGNNRIRKVSIGGTITTVAGTTYGFSGDGGPATSAQLNTPQGVAVDSAGNLYIADSDNHRVRKVSPGGTITTVAGNETAGYTGDGGPAASAELNHPQFVAVDSVGNLYIADLFACVVRKVALDGTISSYAGDGACFFTGTGGDGGPAASAQLAPYGIAFDSADNLYIVDDASQRIRKASASGTITTIAGQAIIDGFPGTYIGDGGLATNAQFNVPSGVAVDSTGKIYVADTGDNAVRVLLPDVPSSLSIAAGNNQTGEVGWTLPNPLQAVVNGPAGFLVPGVTVNFAVTSGSATLGAASAVTNSTGTVSVALTLGSTPGSIVVSVTAPGTNLAAVQFNLTAVAASGGSIPCTISAPPTITSVKDAGDFGGFSYFASGSYLEVHGTNLAVDTRQWAAADFQGANAPTGLDTSSVSINKIPGFVSYISGSQVNVQAPGDPTTGSVQMTVSNCAGTSAPFAIQKNAVAPGVLAPASFNIGGKQYLAALFAADLAQGTETFVGNSGLIAGANFRPAKPGDVIVVYGLGFGGVTPAIAPGVIAGTATDLANLSVGFGQTPATLGYTGLYPGYVGLYEFYVTVPNVPNGDVQISISVNGVAAPQAVYLTVHQ